jgi:aminomuconate-semialdehyde/2-hydroxymuconate-6-semialdehyde dehydrogenase
LLERIKNYIDGELVPPVSGEYLENYDPSIGEVYSLTPDSDNKDIDLAVQASLKAFPSWSVTPVEERSKMMFKIAGLIEKNLDKLALAECIDNGKPLSLARSIDIPRAVKNFEFFAAAIISFSSKSHSMEDKALNYTLRQPLGVVGAISPWNLPLYLFTWKIAPALVTGNCVVAKPSEITPMTAYLLSELCIEAGLPKGVLNIVHGYGNKVGSAIPLHPEIKAVTFTGGTKTGADIASKSAPMFKKLSLELGGKNPNIIFADCNYEKMLETTLKSSFSNQGEICFCGSRILIEETLYKKFKKDFVHRTKRLSVGDPLKSSTVEGAIVSSQHMEKILYYIELAKKEGGNVLCGGNRVKLSGRCKNGWFVEPTVLEGLPYNCRTNMEEIFGPVVTLSPFKTEEEALMIANATEYGLVSIIWTENLTHAHRLSAQLNSGIIWVNCWMLRDLRTPFGGMKNSGIGREGGDEALRFFTEPKNVCIKI